MASYTERNVAGLYTGEAIDSIEVRLHSDAGWEVTWCVWEDQDHEYHVFADTDDSTVDFLHDDHPEQLTEYLEMVDRISTASSRWLSLINSFIAAHTYNSIRPLIEDEDNWLELNEEELDRD